MKTINLTESLYACSKELLEARNSSDSHKKAKDCLGNLVEALRSFPPVASSRSYEIQPGYGIGSFADVPWVALRDTRASANATDGFYIVFLFTKDGERVYLSLIVAAGAGPGRQFRSDDFRAIANKAAELKQHCVNFLDPRYFPIETMDLGSTRSLPKSYISGTAAFKSYRVNEGLKASSSDLVSEDLAAFLECYQKLISSGYQVGSAMDHSLVSKHVHEPFNIEALAVFSTSFTSVRL